MRGRMLVIVLAAAVFCPLVVFAGYATGMRTPRRGIAFTLRGKLTHYQPDGTTVVEEVTRYESADGSWRELRRVGENVNEQFFQQGRGHFSVNHQRRLLVRSDSTSTTRDNAARSTPEELLKSPQFNRTELLLGRTAYVMQIRSGETLMAEVYVVPEFGNTPVKYVDFDAEGRVTSIEEPESITPGEPAAADLKGPDYPEAPTKRALSKTP